MLYVIFDFEKHPCDMATGTTGRPSKHRIPAWSPNNGSKPMGAETVSPWPKSSMITGIASRRLEDTGHLPDIQKYDIVTCITYGNEYT